MKYILRYSSFKIILTAILVKETISLKKQAHGPLFFSFAINQVLCQDHSAKISKKKINDQIFSALPNRQKNMINFFISNIAI